MEIVSHEILRFLKDALSLCLPGGWAGMGLAQTGMPRSPGDTQVSGPDHDWVRRVWDQLVLSWKLGAEYPKGWVTKGLLRSQGIFSHSHPFRLCRFKLVTLLSELHSLPGNYYLTRLLWYSNKTLLIAAHFLGTCYVPVSMLSTLYEWSLPILLTTPMRFHFTEEEIKAQRG